MEFEADGWPSAEQAVCSGNIQPYPLPYGRGSDWAMRLFNRARARKSGCWAACQEKSALLPSYGAAGGQDARAPGMA